MVNHHLHQLCLVLLKTDPIFPPLEAGRRRFRVIALKVISKLLVRLPLQRCLEVIDVLAQSNSFLFMFTNLLILHIDHISSVILQLLEVWELLHVCVDSPQLYGLLLLALIKILKDPFPVSPCYFMMVSVRTECMIMLSQDPLVPGSYQMCSWFFISLVLFSLSSKFLEPSKGIFTKPVPHLAQDLITAQLANSVSLYLISPSIERVLLHSQYILFEQFVILFLFDGAYCLSLNFGLLSLGQTFIL